MNAAFLNNVILKYGLQFSRLEELISGIRKFSFNRSEKNL